MCPGFGRAFPPFDARALRVLLGRALYKQPRLLILDEATSHLDVELEASVNAAVGHLAGTRIIVAHRPQTIASAERVLVVDGSGVREFNMAPVVP